MSEIRANILQTKEVKGFKPLDWVNDQIVPIKKKYERNYDLSSLTIGISAGIPSGVTGSLTITFTPKKKP